MKKAKVNIRTWILWGGVIVMGVTLVGCAHDPNHGIDREQAKDAARRVHTPPDPSEITKMGPGHGG